MMVVAYLLIFYLGMMATYTLMSIIADSLGNNKEAKVQAIIEELETKLQSKGIKETDWLNRL